MPNKVISLKFDYAENWAAKYPDEPSSVYYDRAHPIALIHRIVFNYRISPGFTFNLLVRIISEGAHTFVTNFDFLKRSYFVDNGNPSRQETIHLISHNPARHYYDESQWPW